MSELGKPFLKKNQKKTKVIENQCQSAASENKKPLARNVNLILTKNKSSNELQMNLENHLKNPIEKTVKIKVKLPHVNT